MTAERAQCGPESHVAQAGQAVPRAASALKPADRTAPAEPLTQADPTTRPGPLTRADRVGRVDRAAMPADLAVIVVSTNEGRWLPACLDSVFARAGGIALDVVVVDNESDDGTRELVERHYPAARVVAAENRGFAHANNRALLGCRARYVLFLNPDTELVRGTLAELVRALDERPRVGLVGVRHLGGDGALYPTIRRFPNALRAVGEALGAERLPGPRRLARALRERELDPRAYEREGECDWTTGAFMLARREALQAAGLLDERFFIYSEETDLCRRIKDAGWQVRHLPALTIVHYAGKGGLNPRMEAQDAYARLQYARKHLSPLHRGAYRLALGLGRALRWLRAVLRGEPREREAHAAALAVLAARARPPFGAPPAVALRSRERASGRGA